MKFFMFLRRHRAVCLLIAIALALRLWYLSVNQLWPQFSNADDGDYYQRALRLAVTGQYIDDNWLIRPPFHVWIFATWIKLALLFGQPPTVGVRLIQGFQIALGVVMVPLCYAVAARMFNHRAGLWFAAFWAIWFPFVELPATLFSEPIYLFLFTLHLWLLVRFDDTNRLRDLALSGVVLGMAALTRSPALYALVFAVPWLCMRHWPHGSGRLIERARTALRPAIKPFAALTICTLAVVLPWTARNWLVYHRFIPVDTLGPINLWLDLGTPEERTAKIEQLRQLPQADRQAYATEQVRAIVAVEPLHPFRNLWPTFQHVWKAQFVEDFWVKRSFSTRPLDQVAPLGLLGDVLWLVVSFAGVIGLLHPQTDRPLKLLLGLWLIYSFVTVLIFHVEPRYLLPIWLLLGLYGAWTISQGRAWLRPLLGRRVRASVIGLSVIALAVLIVSYRDYPAIIARGVQRDQHMQRGDLAYAAGDFEVAEREYRAALAIFPQFVNGEIALALALGAQGRYQEGIASLSPDASRRSVLVAGALQRAAGNEGAARALLGTIESRSGEDAQRWAIETLPVEPREALLLGNDALDLGYVAGFAGSELAGQHSYRWLLGAGEVQLPLTEPLAVGDSVLIEIAAPLDLQGPVQVRLNDGPPLSIQPDPRWRAYRFAVPPSLAGKRVLRLRLDAPTHLPMSADSASNDPRALSIMVHRVAVQ